MVNYSKFLGAILAIALLCTLTLSRHARADELPPAAPATPPARATDFNGQACADLAIGAQNEDRTGPPNIDNHGSLHLAFGMPGSGLTASGSQYITQDTGFASYTVTDSVEANDRFGGVLAYGDFNADGFHDLAVGIPYEDNSTAIDPGAVQVFYGSTTGFDTLPDMFFTQDTIGGIEDGGAEDGDLFGASMAAGDFNGDGFDDLAAGSPGESVFTTPTAEAGAIHILYGSPGGLSTLGSIYLDQESTGLNLQESGEYDFFGRILAAGDFDGDGYADLAVTALGEDVGTVDNAGAVTILSGSAAGITTTGNQYWTQADPDIATDPADFDWFGFSLEAADLNGDGFDDLAVGTPWEDAPNDAVDAGMLTILMGSSGGLNAEINANFNPNFFESDLCGVSEEGDNFAYEVAAGDINGDRISDLVIAAPNEDSGEVLDSGSLILVPGSAAGLKAASAQCLAQSNIPGLAESESDQFGETLAIGDFNCDRYADLAVGIPGEQVGTVLNAGAVAELHGGPTGLIATLVNLWSQETSGLADQAETGDGFGEALAAVPIHWSYLFLPIA